MYGANGSPRRARLIQIEFVAGAVAITLFGCWVAIRASGAGGWLLAICPLSSTSMKAASGRPSSFSGARVGASAVPIAGHVGRRLPPRDAGPEQVAVRGPEGGADDAVIH
jgi:hypothetical protein